MANFVVTLKDRIFALPVWQRLLIWFLCLIIIGGGGYYFLIKPTMDENKQIVVQLERDRKVLLKLKKEARQRDKFEKRVKKIEFQFKTALQLLPDKKEIPELLYNISNTARQAGLDVVIFKPLKKVAKDVIWEIPVKIKLTGRYHDVGIFFDRVSKLPRIVNIYNISMSGYKVKTGKLTTTCLAKTFQFRPQGAKSKKKKAKKGKKKK